MRTRATIMERRTYAAVPQEAKGLAGDIRVTADSLRHLEAAATTMTVVLARQTLLRLRVMIDELETMI